MDKHQKLDGLNRRSEELAAYAKKHGLQVFVIHEIKDGQISIQQHCTEELLVNLAAHLGMNHPEAIHRANSILKRVSGIEQAIKSEKSKPESAVLGLDGKPLIAEA